MKVLVLGSGAREHSIAWKFANSNRISGLYIAPGNAGTSEIGENVPDLDPLDSTHIISFCNAHQVKYLFIGPEAPLAAGVADACSKAGIATIGPGKKSAALESSKSFSKSFMLRNNIPTAQAEIFTDITQFETYLSSCKYPVVIKKNGLAAGKGVLESSDPQTMLEFAGKILPEDTLLAEERLEGFEISVFAITDGKTYKILPSCADFKKALPHDKGPNTGGMGAICPVPMVSSELMQQIETDIVAPTFAAMHKEGLSYKGVLFFGLMITSRGPRVLEYNVRFGDPETQVLLPLIESDFGNLTEAMVQERLADFPIEISPEYALGVVIASPGYPGSYPRGLEVTSLPTFPESEVLLFHAGTRQSNKQVVTGGGRCFTVVGRGPDIISANRRAYQAAKQVDFKGAWYRDDIGQKFFREEL